MKKGNEQFDKCTNSLGLIIHKVLYIFFYYSVYNGILSCNSMYDLNASCCNSIIDLNGFIIRADVLGAAVDYCGTCTDRVACRLTLFGG